MRPVVIERGKPVRDRAKDIGALTARRVLNGESNFCYGEGGAGTWRRSRIMGVFTRDRLEPSDKVLMMQSEIRW